MVAGGSGRSEPKMAGREAFGKLERVALRRVWWASGSLFALVAVPVVILTVLEPPAVDQIPYFALNIGIFFSFPVAYLLLLRWGIRRTIRRLAPLSPRIRDADAPVFGPMLELDNGLLVTFSGGFVSFTRFFGPTGEPLALAPAEGAKWMRWSRTTRVGFIRSGGRASSSAPVELDALRTRLGARFCVASVSVPKTVEAPSAPHWVVTLGCTRMFSALSMDRLVPELDAIDAFLARLQSTYAASRHP